MKPALSSLYKFKSFYFLIPLLFVGAIALGYYDKLQAKSIGSALYGIINRYDYFPEYHVDTDIRYFTNQKNPYFDQRYFLETTTKLEFVLISNRRNIDWLWGFDLQSGMGQTEGNVVFDPMDINYGIIPTLEITTKPLLFQGGIEHRCFHEIDRADFEVVYWNQLFLAVGSRNAQLYEYWKKLSSDSILNFSNRFSWFLETGYYVKSFFGLITPGNLNGENRKENELKIESRYAFYRRRSWIIDIHSRATLGTFINSEDKRNLFWRWDFGVDFSSRRGRHGALIFIDYSLDHLPRYQNLPRFSKDKLLQIGVRFFD